MIDKKRPEVPPKGFNPKSEDGRRVKLRLSFSEGVGLVGYIVKDCFEPDPLPFHLIGAEPALYVKRLTADKDAF